MSWESTRDVILSQRPFRGQPMNASVKTTLAELLETIRLAYGCGYDDAMEEVDKRTPSKLDLEIAAVADMPAVLRNLMEENHARTDPENR